MDKERRNPEDNTSMNHMVAVQALCSSQGSLEGF